MMKNIISYVILFFSITLVRAEEFKISDDDIASADRQFSKNKTLSDYFFLLTPWDNPLRGVPIKISNIMMDSYYSDYQIDVINEFGKHQIIKTDSELQNTFKVTMSFFNLFDIFYILADEDITLRENNSFVLSENQNKFRNHSYGIGVNYRNFRFEVGLGEIKNSTYLETDTSLFYQINFEASYYKYGLHVLVPTKIGLEIYSEFSAELFKEGQSGVIKIEKGKAREFSGGIVMSLFNLRFVTYYLKGYRNFKFVHIFFGLENEMSNRYLYSRFGLKTNLEF